MEMELKLIKNKKIFFVFILFILLLPLRFVGAGTLVKAPNNLGLVGYWSFNEATGTVATDSSGSKNHGTLNTFSAPASITSGWGAGKLGGGLVFDGSSDYVNTTIQYNNPSPFSISVWFKTTTASGAKIVGFETDQTGTASVDYDRELYIGTDGKLYFGWFNGAIVTIVSTRALNDGKWHHAIATHDSSTGTLYIDGTSQGTNNGPPQNFTGYWRIGGYKNTGWTNGLDGYFTGSIDDVRIYNRGIGASEVLVLYNSGSQKINFSQNTLLGTTLQNGLVGFWSFNAADTGDKIYDRSGQSNDGYFYNGATSTSKTIGKIGQALNFDGIDDYVYAGTGSSLTDIGPSTWSVWLKRNDSSFGSILYKSDGNSTRGWYIDIGSFGTGLAVVCGNTNFRRYIHSSNITVGEWKHLLITWDGATTTTSGAHIYVDGNEITTYQQDGPCVGDHNSDSTYPLLIAQYGGGTEGYFNGKMDEVRIYSRVLSASEIKQLYNASAGSKINTSSANPPGTTFGSGLVGYWSFNGQDVTDKVYDKSGQGNNGYFYNGATSTAKRIGKVGQALNFDNVDDYVNAGSGSSLDDLSLITVTAWIKPNSFGLTNKGRIVDKSGGGGSGWSVLLCNDAAVGCNQNLRFEFGNGGSGPKQYVTPNSSISTTSGAWQHVAVVYDTGSSNQPVMYINGASQTVTTVTSSGSFVSDASNDLLIGNRTGASRAFDGVIDEVRVYNRLLSASEIKQLYNLGR